MGINQTLRYSLQHLLLSDDMSEFNARAQLRKFRTLEKGHLDPGVPSGISNPFDWPSRNDFKKAKTVAEARRLLPAAVKEAAEKAVAKYPNNPGQQAQQFQTNWRALYSANQGFTPALPESRKEQQHLERIRYLGLKAPAVEDKLHRRKPEFLGSETLGRKAVELVGGDAGDGSNKGTRKEGYGEGEAVLLHDQGRKGLGASLCGYWRQIVVAGQGVPRKQTRQEKNLRPLEPQIKRTLFDPT